MGRLATDPKELWDTAWDDRPRVSPSAVGAFFAGSTAEGIYYGLSQGYATTGYEDVGRMATILGGLRALAAEGLVRSVDPSIMPNPTKEATILAMVGGSDGAADEALIREAVAEQGLEAEAWHYRALSLLDMAEWVGTHHEGAGDWLVAIPSIWLQIAGLTTSVKEGAFSLAITNAREEHEAALIALSSSSALSADLQEMRDSIAEEIASLEGVTKALEYGLAVVVGGLILAGVGYGAGQLARKAKEKYV